MPPRGGSSIGDKDLEAVAAYVWSLGRNAGRAAAPGQPPPTRSATNGTVAKRWYRLRSAAEEAR